MSVFLTSLETPLLRETEMTQATGTSSIQTSPTPAGQRQVVPFADMLREMVGTTNQALNQADEATTSFARGQQNDLHGTMLALSQANIRLQLVNETRNHLLEAYREVMRMSV